MISSNHRSAPQRRPTEAPWSPAPRRARSPPGCSTGSACRRARRRRRRSPERRGPLAPSCTSHSRQTHESRGMASSRSWPAGDGVVVWKERPATPSVTPCRDCVLLDEDEVGVVVEKPTGRTRRRAPKMRRREALALESSTSAVAVGRQRVVVQVQRRAAAVGARGVDADVAVDLARGPLGAEDADSKPSQKGTPAVAQPVAGGSCRAARPVAARWRSTMARSTPRSSDGEAGIAGAVPAVFSCADPRPRAIVEVVGHVVCVAVDDVGQARSRR